MNYFKFIFSILILSCLVNSSAIAEHLKGKSQKELDRFLEGRIVGTPGEFNKVFILPSKTSISLNKELIENKNTKNIDKIIKKKKFIKRFVL